MPLISEHAKHLYLFSSCLNPCTQKISGEKEQSISETNLQDHICFFPIRISFVSFVQVIIEIVPIAICSFVHTTCQVQIDSCDSSGAKLGKKLATEIFAGKLLENTHHEEERKKKKRLEFAFPCFGSQKRTNFGTREMESFFFLWKWTP